MYVCIYYIISIYNIYILLTSLFLFLFVIVSLSLNAQYFTNHAKNINNKDTDGYYYYLTRNIIRLDFVVEEKLEMKGKYSSYAKEMLNTDDYIKENKKTYKIKSVDVIRPPIIQAFIS